MDLTWNKKQNFKNNEEVVIYNIDDRGTIYQGQIKGKSFINALDSYIVELSLESQARLYADRTEQLRNDAEADKWECIAITEACLMRLSQWKAEPGRSRCL